MDWTATTRKRDEFEKNSTVVSNDVFTDFDTEDNDQTETVSRQVEGKFAEDVRKRVKAPADEPVIVEEVAERYWLSEVTADTDYKMTVMCHGVSKRFNYYSAHENFKKLLEWLDEAPETPVGGDVPF